jgi:hypothetical protein
MSNTLSHDKVFVPPKKSAGISMKAVYLMASVEPDRIGHFCAAKKKGVA